jgi:hypothetical protein
MSVRNDNDLELSSPFSDDPSLRVRRVHSPWPLYLIDGFLPEDLLNLVDRELLSVTSENRWKELEDHPFKTVYALSHEPSVYLWFQHNSFIQSVADEYDVSLSISPNQGVQYRRMRPESPPIFPHHDFGGVYSFGMLLYLSEYLNKSSGGEFIMMRSVDPDRDVDQIIEPIRNRALFFFNAVSNYHRVNALRSGVRDSIVIEWSVR